MGVASAFTMIFAAKLASVISSHCTVYLVNPASVWAPPNPSGSINPSGYDGITISSVSGNPSSSTAHLLSTFNPCVTAGGFAVRALVPETFFKEALPCEMSPLGYHLSMAIKEKLWKGSLWTFCPSTPLQKTFFQEQTRRLMSGVRMREAGPY